LRMVVRLTLLRGLQCYSDGAPSVSIRVVYETYILSCIDDE